MVSTGRGKKGDSGGQRKREKEKKAGHSQVISTRRKEKLNTRRWCPKERKRKNKQTGHSQMFTKNKRIKRTHRWRP